MHSCLVLVAIVLAVTAMFDALLFGVDTVPSDFESCSCFLVCVVIANNAHIIVITTPLHSYHKCQACLYLAHDAVHNQFWLKILWEPSVL